MTKKYWKKNEVPINEGWYWCKYKGKRGIVVCPCIVIHLDDSNDTFLIRTAKGDVYSSNNIKQFGTIWFGEKIEQPGANG